jgi:hypothetical protein
VVGGVAEGAGVVPDAVAAQGGWGDRWRLVPVATVYAPAVVIV